MHYISIIVILKQILKGPHAVFRFKFRVSDFESIPRAEYLYGSFSWFYLNFARKRCERILEDVTAV